MEAVYKSYYTKSDHIVDYMVNKLCVNKGSIILEPCAGDGAFIDAIMNLNPKVQIDAYELNPSAHTVLIKKYNSFPNISIRLDDTLTSNELSVNSLFGGYYDRIIANPPYGGWQDYEKRKSLKKAYKGLYVKETYSLFLYRCIKLLKDKGILVFIIPDTFLNLHMHTSLREHILTNTKVQEIALFPSSFFPGVNFGYSNLSIITLQKSINRDECLSNKVKFISGFKNVEELIEPSEKLIYISSQEQLLANTNHALYVTENPIVSNLISSCSNTIGDIAQCVTGFYSGDDKTFLRSGSKNHRNSHKYPSVEPEKISMTYDSIPDILNGINDHKCFIPIVKGGSIKYYKANDWFMNWGTEAVMRYKKDKKARFQNSNFYFKSGVGIPMVSSSQITASLIENRLFDQSIVGVFPNDKKWLYYLLALFNSPTCNILIRTINRSTNNSANYIKKIPFLEPSHEILDQINKCVLNVVQSLKVRNSYDKKEEETLNGLIYQIYGF
jgi:adenine-specific DNA-methyltransferase